MRTRISKLTCFCLLLGFFFFVNTYGALQDAAESGEAAAAPEPFWLWQLLGRFHPLIVHFPIGLLCVAFLLEVIDWRRRSVTLRAGIHMLLWIGTVSAVLAVLFGWLLAGNEGYAGENIEIHRWAGIATMTLAIITLFVFKKGRIALYRFFLVFTVAGVSLAGHYGAMVTHGSDYLTAALPLEKDERPPAAGSGSFSLASMDDDETLTEQQVRELNLEVRTVLAHNCYNCHSEEKMKGELRLDSKELLMKGGEGGPVVVPGKPEKSELIRRIALPAGHDEVMPAKGSLLSEEEINTLAFWVKKGAPWPEGEEQSIYRVAELEPRMPELPPATGSLTWPVDRLVNAYFQENGIEWQDPVSDRVYIRRVYLDVTGLLPTPEQVGTFIGDTSPGKRERLVRELLERDEDYAQHWLSFWNDLLRNDYTGTGYITGGRSDITEWLYNALMDNKPYDRFVKELINPTGESEGFIKGIQWRGVVNASQRTEMQAAQNVSQVFLGLNIKCASCHDSFISDWKLDDAYAFANIFADTVLEINRCDKPTGEMAGRRVLFPELGEVTENAPTKQRLRELADILVQPKDGRLYRTIVNRMWAKLMGRGIIEPVDMMDNLPWSQDLLDWLAADFAAGGYDLKKLIYQILTSKTYQLPSVSVEEPEELLAEDFRFRGMIRRRLSAEQFADAVSTVFAPVYADTALVDNLSSVPRDLPFVRASMVKNDAFLKALGRPTRETVATSRTSQASLLQALELTNGATLNQTLERGAEQWKQQYTTTDTLVNALYLKALGRPPVSKELLVAKEMLGNEPTEEDIRDLVWAVMLVPEFQLIY